MTGQNGDYATDQEMDTDANYVLRLYVTGANPNSVRAITNVKQICEEYLTGRYELDIIDVYQQPTVTEMEQIVALPLLVKKFPLPERKMIGDISDREKVLRGLSIKVKN